MKREPEGVSPKSSKENREEVPTWDIMGVIVVKDEARSTKD